VGPIASSFRGTVTKTTEDSPRLLKARLQGKDQKTASMVTGVFTSELASLDGRSTEVGYQFDIAIRGRLGQFGQAVILDTSKQLTEQFVNCVRARVEQPDAKVESAAPRADVAGIAFRAFLANLWSRLVSLFRKPGS
jgi:carbon monoxide dehydrogenase subunit G